MGGLYHEAGAKTSVRIVVGEAIERGVAYGEGCFETFRVVHGEVFDWPAHAARLCTGLAGWGYALAPDILRQMHRACLRAAATVADDALVRLTVAPGTSAWGMLQRAETLVAHVLAMPAPARGSELWLVSHEWPWAPLPKPAKYTADYGRLGLVLRRLGTQDVVFTHQGQILSAAVANVLIYRQGKWWTPRSGDGVLPGIVRGHLLASGIVREAECPAAWLHDCEAMALTSSGVFVRPVTAIDGRVLGEQRQAWSILRRAWPPALQGLW